MERLRRGWSDPYKPIYFPKLNMPDNVSEYFGAHVAAYFHFYNAFTRWLVIPAVFSAAFPFVRPHIPTHEAHRLDSCFGGFLCIWTTVFLARMKHTMNEKLLRWGMGESVQNVTPVRKNFKDWLLASKLCPGNHISGCLDALRADLQLFFITQVISVGAGLMVQLAMMYWTVRKELQRKKSDDGKLSYVEVQAMLADYDEEAEVSDYLQVVLNFGFLSMFGCVAPSMCVLCFLSNLPMKRLLAFRFSFSQKRVVPIITHGLGSWELILNFIAYIGVTLTCYIVIFAYNSLDLEDFRTQLLLFIAIERAVAVLKLMLTLVFGEKSLAQERIEEQNEEVLELIVAIPAGASAALVAAVAADYRLQWTHDLWLAWKLGPILVGGRMRMNWDSYNIADMWKESDCDNISNQMAHFLLQQGLCPGQVCALMMENKPEFVCWWLGMAKIGVKVAMLNYNLTGRGLAHCVSVAECCALIFDEGTEVNLHSMDSQIKETGLQLFCWGGKPHLNFSTTPTVVDYDLLLSFPYRGDFVELRKGINFTDVFGFIYTSGTTGLPKAAKVTHARMYGLGGVSRLLALQPGDVLYTCLPLYHTAGGALGAMSCFLSGATMALAKKFSAARFWREISEQRCTVFQYIGELGRYLVNYARCALESARNLEARSNEQGSY
eukprot:g27842.t2